MPEPDFKQGTAGIGIGAFKSADPPDATEWSFGSFFDAAGDLVAKGVDVAGDVLGGVFDLRQQKIQQDIARTNLKSRLAAADASGSPVNRSFSGGLFSSFSRGGSSWLWLLILVVLLMVLFFRK